MTNEQSPLKNQKLSRLSNNSFLGNKNVGNDFSKLSKYVENKSISPYKKSSMPAGLMPIGGSSLQASASQGDIRSALVKYSFSRSPNKSNKSPIKEESASLTMPSQNP